MRRRHSIEGGSGASGSDLRRWSPGAIALAVGLLVLSLIGCAKSPGSAARPGGGVVSGGGTSGSPAVTAPSTGDPSAIGAMTPAEKSSQIATSFPLEVPVAAGKVLRGEAQGDSAWDYELLVSARSADVSAFYLSAYRAANWQVASEAQVGEDGHRFGFVKGDAQSEVTIEPQENDTTLVTVTLGLGVGVLQTQ